MFPIFYLCLLSLLSCLGSAWDHGHHQHCLTDEDATDLMNKYYSIWSSRDLTAVTQIVNDLVTDNFTREDETLKLVPVFLFSIVLFTNEYFSFGLGPCVIGPEGPYAPNKQVFLLTLAARLAETTIANEAYETLWMVHDCESIAFRWQASAVAIANANL